MAFLYETHLHTSQSSACAFSPGRDYIRRYQDLGYSGIFITDHFYRGNSAVNRRLPWPEWVKQFCRGYEDAWEEGVRRGLDVFFGWEETFQGDDYLVYGLDGEWLIKHPESASWTRREQFRQVRAAGGCVVQAHPFRQHYYISRIHLSPLVDAVEAGNAGNHEASYDALALVYARTLGLPVTAGSDIHSAEDVREDSSFGIYLEKKLDTAADYVQTLRQGAIERLRVSPGRFTFRGDEEIILPVDIRDENDLSTGRDLWDFLNICR